MATLLESAVRATLIAATFALVLKLLRLRSPAVRHTLWTSLVVLMLLLPASTKWGPEIPIRILAPQSRSEPDIATATVPIRDDFATSGVPQGSRVELRHATWRWIDLLALVYSVGFLVFGMRLLAGTWQGYALVRRATLSGGQLTNPSCATPVTTGLFSPAILLPTAWPTWPQNRLDAILAHEREHVRRWDPLFQWLALLNRAVFWFHPLAWWLPRHIARLAEEACDAAVLASGIDPITYSEALLECAKAASFAGGRLQSVGMAMPGTALPRRIERILAAVDHRPTSRKRLLCATLISTTGATMLMAAVPAQTPLRSPTFEFASVTPNTSEGGVLVYPPNEGIVRLSNMPLISLIVSAYQAPEDQVVGPDWIRTSRFDVVAKPPNGLPIEWDGPNSVRPMLRALLEERFKLVVHAENRSLAKYALMMANSDGTLGPSLKPSATDCTQVRAQRASSLATPAPGQPCTNFRSGNFIVADSVPVRQLVAILVGPASGMGLVDRGVVDRTGLTGLFNFTLTLDPSVSIFTTIHEQLGLKLEPVSVSGEVMVIDHVEQLIEH
jgi:uncharacterized protein (TIGR03435 family)